MFARQNTMFAFVHKSVIFERIPNKNIENEPIKNAKEVKSL